MRAQELIILNNIQFTADFFEIAYNVHPDRLHWEPPQSFRPIELCRSVALFPKLILANFGTKQAFLDFMEVDSSREEAHSLTTIALCEAKAAESVELLNEYIKRVKPYRLLKEIKGSPFSKRKDKLIWTLQSHTVGCIRNRDELLRHRDFFKPLHSKES